MVGCLLIAAGCLQAKYVNTAPDVICITTPLDDVGCTVGASATAFVIQVGPQLTQKGPNGGSPPAGQACFNFYPQPDTIPANKQFVFQNNTTVPITIMGNGGGVATTWVTVPPLSVSQILAVSVPGLYTLGLADCTTTASNTGTVVVYYGTLQVTSS